MVLRGCYKLRNQQLSVFLDGWWALWSGEYLPFLCDQATDNSTLSTVEVPLTSNEKQSQPNSSGLIWAQDLPSDCTIYKPQKSEKPCGSLHQVKGCATRLAVASSPLTLICRFLGLLQLLQSCGQTLLGPIQLLLNQLDASVQRCYIGFSLGRETKVGRKWGRCLQEAARTEKLFHCFRQEVWPVVSSL